MRYRLTLTDGSWEYEYGAKYVKGYIKEFGGVVRVQKIYADGKSKDVTNKYL